MSAAAAETVAEDVEATVPKKLGKKKKLIILVAAAAVAAEGGAEDEAPAPPPPHHDVRRTPPSFLPLDAFVVNLADRDSERFAQIGVTLELDDGKFADQLKAYMPAIRNGILMVLAHKSSSELLSRAGKEKLAAEVMRESVRPLGIELESDVEDAKPAADDAERVAKTPLDESPVRHVHFSSFIIQ